MRIFAFIIFSFLIVQIVVADYYGEGFPVGGPLHQGSHAGGYGAIRYKKVPFPYRSGRNIGHGGYGGYGGQGGYDPYYGGGGSYGQGLSLTGAIHLGLSRLVYGSGYGRGIHG